MNGNSPFVGIVRSGVWLACAAIIVWPPVSVADVPDLEGIWLWSPEAGASDSWLADPPFNAQGRAAFEAVDPTEDVGLRCLFGMPRIIGIRGPYPMEFIQRDDRVVILYEQGHQVRRIFLDGREPAEEHTLLGALERTLRGKTPWSWKPRSSVNSPTPGLLCRSCRATNYA